MYLCRLYVCRFTRKFQETWCQDDEVSRRIIRSSRACDSCDVMIASGSCHPGVFSKANRRLSSGMNTKDFSGRRLVPQ